MNERFESVMCGSTFRRIYEKLRFQPRIASVIRMPLPSREIFFRDIAPAGYPVIFKNGVSEGTSLANVVQLLSERHGDFIVKARTGEYSDPVNYISNREYKTMPLREYLQHLFKKHDGQSPYAGNQQLPPEVTRDLKISAPIFYPEGDFEPAALWLGPRGSVTPLHKDSTDNFAFHLLGRKKWILFPVRDIPELYMSRILPNPESDFAASAIDLRSPDLIRFPAYKSAVGLETELRRGDILYLPAGWGHYVENLEDTLMVNYWTSIGKRPPGVLVAGI